MEASLAKPVALLKGPRGDLDRWNQARWLWAQHQHRKNGLIPVSKFAPWEAAFIEKAQAESNGQDGGFLAPEEWTRQFTDIIRDESALRRNLPIQYLTTDSRLAHFPVGTSEWTWTYQTENVNLGTSAYSTRKFGEHVMTPRKAIAIQQFPLELFQDASDIADQFLQRSSAEAVAFEQDSKTLVGNGQLGQPVGILNSTNVTVTNLNATPTMTNLGTGIFNAMNLNGSTNVPVGSTPNIGVVTAPRILVTLAAMTAAGSEPWLFGLGPQASQNFLGVRWTLTNSVPINLGGGSNQSLVFYGDWRYVVVLQRGEFAFDIGDPYKPRALPGVSGMVASGAPDFASAQVDVKIVFRYDITVLRPEAFFVHGQVNQ